MNIESKQFRIFTKAAKTQYYANNKKVYTSVLSFVTDVPLKNNDVDQLIAFSSLSVEADGVASTSLANVLDQKIVTNTYPTSHSNVNYLYEKTIKPIVINKSFANQPDVDLGTGGGDSGNDNQVVVSGSTQIWY